ncbi:MAG TPA: oligoribonuclease [Kofleriaceae bacterium]|nr:oligoribonuclease [Kofleriaceae bacterium]
MSSLLLWMDMEMTGLEPDRDRVLELATLVTNAQLDVIALGPELVVHQPDDVLGAMDAWNTSHHGASGLTARSRASSVTEADAELATLAFLDAHFGARDRPVLCGNSIHQDRRFVRRYMKALDARLHYRMVDVSTIKELARRWYPEELGALPAKNDAHRALDDIQESVAELRFYREHLFVPPKPKAE